MNDVHIYHSLRGIKDIPELSKFYGVIEDLLRLLNRPVATTCKLSKEVVDQYCEDYQYATDGYDNKEIIDQAVPLSDEAVEAANSNATKNGGWRRLLTRYFDTLRFSKRFCER